MLYSFRIIRNMTKPMKEHVIVQFNMEIVIFMGQEGFEKL